MAFFSPENWPLWFLSVAMVVAAVIDGWKLKVPNWLTFPLILSGWLLGLIHDFGWLTGSGGIGASLAGTALGFALLLPVYAIGGMGAGDVKMQMGFGAWVGAFAFIVMRDRIQRQISQRTEMLAGVSHDLRTPLTRMKLALELAWLPPTTLPLPISKDAPTLPRKNSLSRP